MSYYRPNRRNEKNWMPTIADDDDEARARKAEIMAELFAKLGAERVTKGEQR